MNLDADLPGSRSEIHPASDSDHSAEEDDFVLKEAALIQSVLRSRGDSLGLQSALGGECFSVSERLVLEVLRRHRSDWKAASSFFDWASVQEGYSHGSRAYNEMLDILGRMKQIKLMRQLFDGIPHEPSAPIVNEKTFAVLVNRYAAAHKVADAIKVFYKRREYGLDLDLSAFQKLLTALCRYKHVEEAEALFLQKRAEFPPVIRSRNIILNGWCVLGSLREAKRFWNDIVTSDCKPDLYTYGIFINSLAKAGKLGTAVKLFTAMWAKGCSPDVAICNCIIDALCFKKRIPEALEVFREMDGRGCLPDTATYNTLLKHLCGIGRMEEARSLLSEMEQRRGGCAPNARTFTYFLKAAKDAGEAAAMVSRMRSAGCEPDADTYNLLLNLYVRWGDRRGVASIWSEMEDRGLGPDQRSYTVVIHGLRGRGRLDEARQVYAEMKSKGMIPEPRTRLLIKAIELGRTTKQT
ncbi:unnamed protein product [Spirodela intermedia]|uniref:Uncharacterized protein n=1 Tax=Spirodela intermedia TaxID=51605 RepID=A0A7I8L8V8_SPIIN|nr:unnamed protein product [Spirodela intermedia]